MIQQLTNHQSPITEESKKCTTALQCVSSEEKVGRNAKYVPVAIGDNIEPEANPPDEKAEED